MVWNLINNNGWTPVLGGGHPKSEDADAHARSVRKTSREQGLHLNYRVEFIYGAGVFYVFERRTLAIRRAKRALARA